jgi:protein SCO1/2
MQKKRVRLLALITGLVGLALLAGGCRSLAPAYEYKGTLFDPPQPVPDFELADTQGRPFHLSELDGDITLIYFGYTFCPDVCPLTMVDVKTALAGLETGRERVHVLFVSVDPERDTPEVLSHYLAAFDPSFIGLTDDFEKTQEMMKPYGAFAEHEEVAGSAAEYLVSHTARIYLVGPQREVLLTYPFGFETEALRSDLAHLIQMLES